MAMKNRAAAAALVGVLGTAGLGIATSPVLAGDAGAFIGGVVAVKVLDNMRDRTEAEQDQADAAQQMAAQQRAAPASSSAEQQLSDLKRMKDKGLITTDEYNEKKKDILDSM
jgi:membrane protease subunit (stomatin/prohibitin family)